jgi:hypothetical protein
MNSSYNEVEVAGMGEVEDKDCVVEIEPNVMKLTRVCGS